MFVELVQFYLKPIVSDEIFLRLADKLEKVFLIKQPGFISRELAKGKDGLWVDYLHWKTLKDAESAGERIEQEAQAKDFMDLINLNSVKLIRMEVKKSFRKIKI
jgi:hypothetical protein